jgi:hypothetical protein
VRGDFLRFIRLFSGQDYRTRNAQHLANAAERMTPSGPRMQANEKRNFNSKCKAVYEIR